MKNEQLRNDVLQGLLVAATLALVAPELATAQDLMGVASNSKQNVLLPIMTLLSYVCYGLGAVLVAAGISSAKKHSESPSSNPLTPAIGKMGTGAGLLAIPYLVKVFQQTGFNTSGGGVATTSNPILN